MIAQAYKIKTFDSRHDAYVLEMPYQKLCANCKAERIAMARELIAAAEFFLEGIKDETI